MKKVYYLDSKGNRMSLSENFSARVPLVSGEISEENCKPFLLLFNEIKKDDFLKKILSAYRLWLHGNVVLMKQKL